ncbi:MAG: response regulator [Vicinamibacterales bacterium]
MKTIVVADDAPFVRDRFTTALERAGHRVVAVTTAAELLDRMRGQVAAYDLLLLDLRLSQSSGTDLIRALRHLDAEARVPILVFSGTIASAAEVRALSALGVAGYINEYSAEAHIAPSIAPHLFPERFNRRGGPRMAIGMPMQYRVGATTTAALTLDLGHGGLAVRTASPLAVDTPVQLRFRLPATRLDIDAEGRVVWADARLGMGIRFDVADAESRVTIRDFVDAHFFSNRTS